MWVRGRSEEPGARDSGSSPGCVTGQGPFSPWASAIGGGAHPACCVPSQGRGEVQSQPWIEKLSKLTSPAVSRRGGFLLLWPSGAGAWLCDLEQRTFASLASVSPSTQSEWEGTGPCLPSSPPHWPLHYPWTFSLSLLAALDVRPLWLPCLVPCPQHCLALLLSSLLFLPLSLTTPISASSFLLGSRFLLSPLCLWTPAPARPGSHSDGCKGTLPPPHSHPGPGDPTVQGAPRLPSLPLLPPPCGAISVEVPLGIGGSATSAPSNMTRCVILGKSQPPLASVSPVVGQATRGGLPFSAEEHFRCDL